MEMGFLGLSDLQGRAWCGPARLAAWAFIAAALARREHVDLLMIGITLGADFLTLSVLSFGLLTRPLIAIVELALAAESAVFALSEGIVLGTISLAPRAATFVAALGLELGLIYGFGVFLRAVHAGDRVWAVLVGILR